jgi:hypothetical protein
MRAPLLLVAALAALALVAAPVQAKAKAVKACQLLTPGQVQTVVGEPVSAGKPVKVPAKGTTSCAFTATATPGALFVLQVTQGPGVKASYAAGRTSLPSHALIGIGQKAYQVDETSTIGFLYQGFYVILQPPGTIAKTRDLSAMPKLAKTVVQALKAWS